VYAWARATPLGSLRVVHGPANDRDVRDDNAMYAACAVHSLQGQVGAMLLTVERSVESFVDILGHGLLRIQARTWEPSVG